MQTTVIQTEEVMEPTLGHRARFWGTTLMVWALFYFVVGPFAFPLSSSTALTVAAGPYGVIGSVAFIVAVAAAAAFSALAIGTTKPMDALRAVFLGIAIWSFREATIDDWLHARAPRPGAPTGAPYWPLLSDYVVILVAILVSVRVVDGFVKKQKSAGALIAHEKSFARLGALPARTSYGAYGVALAVVVVVLHIAMGDPIGKTMYKQTFFAVVVSFWLALHAGRAIFADAEIGSFWSLPFVVGIIGVVVAGMLPALAIPSPYRALNTFAAWGVVRPLPIQLVFVGLTTILWMAPHLGHPAEHSRTEKKTT
ncbi:MAG: hypothetical protein AB7N71_01940 [Phycisphaerae bacterium]